MGWRQVSSLFATERCEGREREAGCFSVQPVDSARLTYHVIPSDTDTQLNTRLTLNLSDSLVTWLHLSHECA